MWYRYNTHVILIQYSYNVDTNVDIEPMLTVISTLYLCHTVINNNVSILDRYQDINTSKYHDRYIIGKSWPSPIPISWQYFLHQAKQHDYIAVDTNIDSEPYQQWYQFYIDLIPLLISVYQHLIDTKTSINQHINK